MVGLLASLPAAPASAAEPPAPGTYKAKVAGGKVRIAVSPSSRATLRYAVRGDCGKLAGRMRLGKLDRGFSKRGGGGGETARARGRVAGGGAKIKGRLAVSGGPAGDSCTERRRFVAKLAGSGLTAADAGRYDGSTSEGLPFGFDLAVEGGRGRISNLAYAVNADCWGVVDEELERTLVARLVGVGGAADRSGDFEAGVSADPDPENDFDDLEYGAYGRIRHGEAWGELELGSALFNDLGLLDPAGLLQCEESSFDFVTFRAYRVG